MKIGPTNPLEKTFDFLIGQAAKAIDLYLERVDSCSSKEEREALERELKKKLMCLKLDKMLKKLP